jgi:hypothetical protein
MILVLSLIKPHGDERVRTAVEELIALGCADAAAIRYLLEADDPAPVAERRSICRQGEMGKGEPAGQTIKK